MLAYIKGKLEMKMTGYVVIDVGGLGYKVFMSDVGIEKLGDIGETVKVHTYYKVREDDISIFGFNTLEELKMFELLISVSGVGAKTALAMLATCEPTEFALAVISEDVKKLTSIPGIGAKSAQRIILELKDKISKEQQIEAVKHEIKNNEKTTNKIQEAIENNAKITSSHTLYAQWKDNTHTVEFIGKDSNGQDTVLATAIIEHGSDMTASILREQGINISDLQKDVNTQEYYYKYIGMETAKFNNITEDRQIKILYENTKNSYTITFYDEDKTTILGTATAEYGANADGSHIIPKKSEDQTYTYVFSGWVDNEGNIDDLGNVIENRNVYATYTPTYKVYKVEFVNDDGSFISDKKDYHYGDNIVIPNNPTKAPTKQYTYIFEGWMDSENNLIDLSKIQVTENAIYTAKYRQELNKYTITFYLDSNKTQKIGESTVDYGTNATYTGEIPTKAEENGYKFTFDKWINKENNEDDLSNVTENRDVIASFIKTPIVYNIEYIDTMGADNSNPLTYTIEDENITLNKLPDIKGMKFIGWFTDTTYTTQINSIITKNLENIKVYAKWDIEDLYLKSQKYKIGENNVDEYEENDIYLYRVNPNTTLTDFISNCDTNGTITVYKKTGEKLGNNEIIGTGMTLKDELNGKVIILTLSVKGDIDGNGKVTATDLAAINQQILKEINLEGAQFKAADISDDKQVTATDLAAINQVILKELDLSTIK